VGQVVPYGDRVVVWRLPHGSHRGTGQPTHAATRSNIGSEVHLVPRPRDCLHLIDGEVCSYLHYRIGAPAMKRQGRHVGAALAVAALGRDLRILGLSR
jgi:hypothetical protein